MSIVKAAGCSKPDNARAHYSCEKLKPGTFDNACNTYLSLLPRFHPFILLSALQALFLYQICQLKEKEIGKKTLVEPGRLK